MRQWFVAAILVICCTLGGAAAGEEEDPINQWTFFDYGEEWGWFNINDRGQSIVIRECEVVGNKGLYRFISSGFFEQYSDDRSKEYWLSAGHEGGELDAVYVYTSKEYFDYLYTFSVDAKRAVTDTALQFCARPIGNEPPGNCESFTGTDFWRVVADLCVPVVAFAEPDPAKPSPGKAAVVAFYLALRAGDGHAAAANVIPEKRKEGPLSAQALSDFYGNLKQPLRLLDVATAGENKFRARYTFETKNGRVCNGVSIVTLRKVQGFDLIAGILAENGC